MKRLLRIAVVAALALVVVGVVSLGVLWRLSRAAPAWYAPPDPSDPVVQTVADRFEYRLLEECQKMRPPEQEWTVRVQESHANAWLSARLLRWMAHQREAPIGESARMGSQAGSGAGDTGESSPAWRWPARLGAPQVRMDPDLLTVALPVRDGDGRIVRTIVLNVRPAIVEGQLTLALIGVRVGRLSVSGEPMTRLLKVIADVDPSIVHEADAQRLIDVLGGRAAIDPVIDVVGGDRRVRIRALRLHDGALDLTAVTIGPAN